MKLQALRCPFEAISWPVNTKPASYPLTDHIFSTEQLGGNIKFSFPVILLVLKFFTKMYEIYKIDTEHLHILYIQ